jgi:hypothetical protein
LQKQSSSQENENNQTNQNLEQLFENEEPILMDNDRDEPEESSILTSEDENQ